jgi:selenide, water dikinase
LHAILRDLNHYQHNTIHHDGQNIGTKHGHIALDCSIRPTRHPNLYCISTTDFFFPLVESPYIQGRIGAANVLSDLYATGVTQCDNVLMLLGACTNMSEKERNICTREMIRGFADTCQEANTVITGGQTVLNPWPIIGGVATSIVARHEFFTSNHIQVNDVVLLTKPLGTQVAVNVHQWQHDANNIHWKECQNVLKLTDHEAERMMSLAVQSMMTLNKNTASLLIKYHATACTDVTGFGIVGHAQNLMDNQIDDAHDEEKERQQVEQQDNDTNHNDIDGKILVMQLHTLPCISKTVAVNNHVMDFQLIKGYSAETSGGLLICMSPSNAVAYRKELMEVYHTTCWMIGQVVVCDKNNDGIKNNSMGDAKRHRVELLDDLKVIEVDEL